MFLAAAFTLFSLVCVWFAFTRHPIWGLHFYLATTYIFPPGRWWGYVFGDFRWALFSAAVTALAVIFHRGKLKPKPLWIGHGPVIILGFYAAWMWVQAAWAFDIDDHVRGSTEFVKCLLAMWFVWRVLDSKERVRDFMLAHVMGCGFLGFLAMTTGRQGDRLDGVGGPNLDDANTLGMYLVTATIVGIGLVMTQKGWRRWLPLVTLPVIVNGFVLANSRGAFLGLVGGGLVLAFCIAKRHQRLFAGFVIVSLVGLTVLVDKVFIDRMFTISDVTSESEDADPSARSRLAIAQAQMRMFSDYPMGIGWRGTAALSAKYMDRKWLTLGDDDTASRSSHNTFLTALVEQGVPGAFFYACLVLWVIGAAFRVRWLRRPADDPELTTLGASLCGALVVILTAGITADYLTKEVQFWLYPALLSVFWLSHSAQLAGQPRPGTAPVRHVTA